MIPKVFHRVWVGGKPLPEEFLFYGETWKDLHPGWKIKLWTDDNMPTFINQEQYDEGGVVLKSDIARIELIYKYGGIYIDTDFECYRNLEPLLKSDNFFSGEKEGVIGNAIFGAKAGHPILRKIIDAMPQSIEENKDFGPNISTGPVFLTKVVDQNKINYLSPKLFFPTPPFSYDPPMQGNKYPKAYAIHHWAASWVGGEEEKIGWEGQQRLKKVGL